MYFGRFDIDSRPRRLKPRRSSLDLPDTPSVVRAAETRRTVSSPCTCDDEHKVYDSYNILPCVTGTLVLSIGDNIEVRDTEFLSYASTLAMQQMVDEWMTPLCEPLGPLHCTRYSARLHQPEGQRMVRVFRKRHRCGDIKQQLVVAMNSIRPEVNTVIR